MTQSAWQKVYLKNYGKSKISYSLTRKLLGYHANYESNDVTITPAVCRVFLYFMYLMSNTKHIFKLRFHVLSCTFIFMTFILCHVF